ncbi:transporter [Aquimarina sp. SS2-1]|uniref:transporter n=1 Tax=Aquimarina besae TaxID=3342247 RepID=UPI00366FDFDC
MQRIILLTFLSCLSFNSMFSQETNSLGPLITDRPDATESPTVVPKGYLQIETGAFFEDAGDNAFKQKTTTFNTALLRYGLLDNLELRVGWDFAEIKTEINGTELDNVESGLLPLLLGAKIGISNEQGLLPEIGIIGHLFLPFTAGQDFRPENTGVDFRFSFAHTLSEKSSLSYNLGAEWGNDSPEAAYVYTIAYGYSITNAFGIYAELYGDLPEDSSANHLWDAGITYLLSDNIQLDATIGSGITEGQNLLLSAGISVRLPN